MRAPLLLCIGFAFACNSEGAKSADGELPDGDTGTEVEECSAVIDNTRPSNEQSGWFYRDALRVTFSDANPDLVATGSDSAGNDLGIALEWDDARQVASLLPASGYWPPSDTVSVTLDFCGNSASLGFSISEAGSPFDADETELIGKTYIIDLTTADYTHPPGIGTLLGSFIDLPLLLGVSNVGQNSDGDEVVDFIAALGEFDNAGDVSQVSALWDFSGAGFSESPYFQALSPLLTIDFGGYDIPVHDFAISGTFESSMSAIVGASFSGLGDTSSLGPALNLGNDPDALCSSLLEPQGVECVQCPGAPAEDEFCVFLAGNIDRAPVISDFRLEECDGTDTNDNGYVDEYCE